ncbi:MAG: PA2169 family four-helix-bundle protein [Pseudomonadota bacterium]
MSTTTDALNDVVSVLKAGQEFYNDAQEKTDNGQLKSVFKEMESTRQQAISDLEGHIEKRGDDAPEASWSEQAKATYTAAREWFTDREGDDQLIAKLEEHEDRTLEAFRSALNEVNNSEAHGVLTRHFTTFKETHDKMKGLKKANAA